VVWPRDAALISIALAKAHESREILENLFTRFPKAASGGIRPASLTLGVAISTVAVRRGERRSTDLRVC
jgi:hypothetical protein